MGWSHLAGLLAALLAAIGLGLALGFYFFLAFLFGVGLPAWWLGYLALLGAPVAANGSAGGMEWYPVGRLVLWAAIIGTLVIAVARADASAPTRKRSRPKSAMRSSARLQARQADAAHSRPAPMSGA